MIFLRREYDLTLLWLPISEAQKEWTGRISDRRVLGRVEDDLVPYVEILSEELEILHLLCQVPGYLR